MNDQRFKTLLAQIAQDSSRVFITNHAQKRLTERKITRLRFWSVFGRKRL
jgi:hypothetical protein